MLRFFRTVRKKLMEQNKIRTYFLYAVGEIFLVVIGILIALQINNWNEKQIERQEEKQLLTQLKSEYLSNLEQLNDKMVLRENMITASKRLLEYVDDSSIRNEDSVFTLMGQTVLNPTFDPILNDIISSGRIQLIKNNVLKEKLTRWTSDVVQVTEEEELWTKYRSEVYAPTIIEFSSVRNLINRYWQDDLFSTFQMDRQKDVALELGNSQKKLDAFAILDESAFEDHIAQCLSLATLTNSQSVSLKNRIFEILDLIEVELEN